jgi:hypothetical protein
MKYRERHREVDLAQPRDVSSCACIAKNVSSLMLTANATDEFLMMFIDSLVSGGITMRRPLAAARSGTSAAA